MLETTLLFTLALPLLCGAVNLLTAWLHVFVESEGRELGERRKKMTARLGFVWIFLNFKRRFQEGYGIRLKVPVLSSKSSVPVTSRRRSKSESAPRGRKKFCTATIF
jgi:hypothetical protein